MIYLQSNSTIRSEIFLQTIICQNDQFVKEQFHQVSKTFFMNK